MLLFIIAAVFGWQAYTNSTTNAAEDAAMANSKNRRMNSERERGRQMSDKLQFASQQWGYDTNQVDGYLLKLTEEYKILFHEYEILDNACSECARIEQERNRLIDEIVMILNGLKKNEFNK